MIMLSREIHGIDVETLRGYLIHLGGVNQPGGIIAGPAWQARLTPLPDYPLGKARFCSFRVEIEGEAEMVRTVMQQFDLRIMRPGG